MNIYEEDGTEGVIDIRRARAELKSSGSMVNEGSRRQTVAEISAAALLDIAASLRVVAADARLGLDDAVTRWTAEEAGEPEPALAVDTGEDFLVVGDRVETLDGSRGEVLSFGASEGSTYALVRWGDGDESKTWLSALVRIASDDEPVEYRDTAAGDDDLEPIDENAIEIVSAERVAEMIGGPAVEDDIDSDFDGDAHPAAASALDLLERNEAERKAKKKGSKK